MQGEQSILSYASSLVTTEQVAERAGLTTARIRQLAKSGKIIGHKFANAWFFEEEEVAKFLRSRSANRS